MVKNKKMAERYRKLRETLDYKDKDDKPCSQDKLAKKLNITKTQISELENGKRKPTTTEITQYHKVFGVPSDYLLGFVDNEKYENISIGETLGLSDKTIEQLKIWEKRDKNGDCIVDILNSIFESGYAGEILKSLALYLFTEPQCFFPHAESTEDFLKLGKTWNDDNDTYKKIDVINSSGFSTTLCAEDLTQIYEKIFLDKLQLMKSELERMGKIPNIGHDTTWSVNPRKNNKNKIERKTNGKRTSKKEQKR